MREIKFRAWDNSTKGMINNYAHVGSYGELYVTQFHSSAYNEDSCPDLILEQYTGLKDKNGKEIYEGDIIRQNTGGKDFIAKWCDEEAGFNLYTLTDGVFQFGAVGWGNEIIGNIHEHKELLK